MDLTKAERRGPWVIVLECGHNAGSKGNPGRRRKCEECNATVSPTTAYYGKKAIPIGELVAARRSDKQVRAERKAKATDKALSKVFGGDAQQRANIRNSPALAGKVWELVPWYGRGGHHRQYRSSLIADGCTPELADKATMDYRWSGLRERAGDERYWRIREHIEGPRRLSDASYKPRSIDPLLKGVARATGPTAAAVRSGKTITDWQHAERTRS